MSKVLIIDDDYSIVKLIKDNLEMEGFLVITASNGFKGIELMIQSKPDIILLDIMMPGMDGYEVCRKLKESPATRGIPLIFLSAKSQADDISLGLKLGADDYITKPFDIMTLGERLKQVLAKKTALSVETPAQEIDQKILNFIEQTVISYTHWDILTYFYSSGVTVRNSIEEIAQAIGRPLPPTQQALDNFGENKILITENESGKVMYSNSTDPEIRNKSKQFLDFAETTFGRLKTIQIIIQKRLASR